MPAGDSAQPCETKHGHNNIFEVAEPSVVYVDRMPNIFYPKMPEKAIQRRLDEIRHAVLEEGVTARRSKARPRVPSLKVQNEVVAWFFKSWITQPFLTVEGLMMWIDLAVEHPDDWEEQAAGRIFDIIDLLKRDPELREKILNRRS